VRGDTALLRSKVLQLRGAAGGARFDAALAAANVETEAALGEAAAAAITVCTRFLHACLCGIVGGVAMHLGAGIVAPAKGCHWPGGSLLMRCTKAKTQ
jgi:hypothetical protein